MQTPEGVCMGEKEGLPTSQKCFEGWGWGGVVNQLRRVGGGQGGRALLTPQRRVEGEGVLTLW